NYHESPAAAFYWGRKTLYLDDQKIFFTQAKSDPSFYCLIHRKDLDPFRAELPKLGLSIKASFENLDLVTKG
ncbi:MAG: hypothetical protein HYZ87_02380, partial [Candidatus Omnitrophica bacterium]|nr:hypothetical protein [Candidatus Omnitrophota bacterium]